MKKIISTVLVLGLLVAGFSLSIDAFGGPQGGPGNKGYNQNRSQVTSDYNNPLDLSEEQIDQMEGIRDDFYSNREELQEKLQETNYELKEVLRENGSDGEVASLRTKINNLQSDITNLRINYWEKVQNVLTDEQVAEMKELEEEYGKVGFGMYGGMNSRFGYSDQGNFQGGFGRGVKGNRNYNYSRRGFRTNCGW